MLKSRKSACGKLTSYFSKQVYTLASYQPLTTHLRNSIMQRNILQIKRLQRIKFKGGLLSSKRFLPCFVTTVFSLQLNDMCTNNRWLFAAHISSSNGSRRGALYSLAAGLLYCHSFYFRVMAGQLAEKTEKRTHSNSENSAKCPLMLNWCYFHHNSISLVNAS